MNSRFWTRHPLIALLTVGTALVWLIFGVWFKIMGMVPRHQLIVVAVLGEAVARPVTILIGIAEVGIALWILRGFKPLLCAVVQSIAIVTMNALELSVARDLLLAPTFMVIANGTFLILVWYWALHTPERFSDA